LTRFHRDYRYPSIEALFYQDAGGMQAEGLLTLSNL
jgi:hypothetical protein